MKLNFRLNQIALFWLFIGILASLTSCGGGSTTPPNPPNIQATNLFYGSKANFYIGVTTLKDGVQLTASNCSSLNPTSSPNPLFMAYSCTVSQSGPLVFSATDASGQTILTKNFTVPAPQVNMVTSQGNVVLELNPNAAPLSVNNFLQYVQDGFYTNTLFHRVISGFVVQAGGFLSGMTPKAPTYSPIALESQNGLSNVRGSLAMARSSAPNSANSQFYVNLVDNLSLDYASSTNPGYAVFGKVISGMDVIDKIASTPTSTVNGYSDVPVADVVITSVTRTQ
jgi:peptidyl-prolyl cis-trans isomerase A (cyclophilin A)